MADNQSVSDYTDAVALWHSLRDYLKIDVEVDVDGPPKADTPVNVKFTVTNIAPSGPDWPEIEFEEVGIEFIGSGISGSSRRIQGLLCGESFAYERKCTFRDLAALDFQAVGTVSRRRFFKVRRPSAIPTTFTKPTVLDYLQAFNDMAIHSTLDSKIKSISIPEPDTPFSQLQNIIGTLTSCVSDIESVQERLSNLARAASGEKVSVHFRTAHEYLNQTRNACINLKEAISSSDSKQIAVAAQAIEELEPAAARVNRATEELMKSYDISDQEANYKYSHR